MLRRFLALPLALAAAVNSEQLMAQGAVVTGQGIAPVTRDANAVRVLSEDRAKIELVREMARRELGDERLGELSNELVERLASQIRPAMIVERSSVRVGSEFRTTLSAQIDRVWFQQQLDDAGIRTPLEVAGGQSQRILILLDESVGAAQDFERPVEVVIEYDRNTGASFNDTSEVQASERSSSSATNRSSSSSGFNRSAAGVSTGPYGAAAVRGSAGGRSSASARSSAASSNSSSFNSRADVQASSYDNTRFRHRTLYQNASSSRSGRSAMVALAGALQDYGVVTTNAEAALAAFSPGPTPLLSELQESGQLMQFFDYAARNSRAPFFLGGQINIRYGGRNPSTGGATCTGYLTASAYSTSDMGEVGSSAPNGSMEAHDYELCAAQLAASLSRSAAEELGPKIQRYWLGQSRDTAARVVSASVVSDYSVSLRASDISMTAQVDFLDALTDVTGIESQAFIGQTGNQFDLRVRYVGSLPLHLAIYQQLRSRPGFAQIQTEVSGQQIIICISAC